MFTAHIPPSLRHVIFVENADSFSSFIEALESSKRVNDTALVCAVNSGIETDIRLQEGSKFEVQNSPSETDQRQFLDWWHRQRDKYVDCFFWGDLNCDSLVHLKSLRKSFTNVQAWQPGYQALLGIHVTGAGDTPDDRNQFLDVLPQATGCSYTDTILVPLLRHSRRSINQKVVSSTELTTLLNQQFN